MPDFQRIVEAGEVRYFVFTNYPIAKRLEGTNAEQIQQWVTDNYEPTWVGDTAVYDLQDR